MAWWFPYLKVLAAMQAKYRWTLILVEHFNPNVAAGGSTLSVQLEDWLEMDKPVNIPGTVDEQI